MVMTVNTLYFSGTGMTRKVVLSLAKTLASKMGGSTKINHIDFTSPAVRKQSVSFTNEDLVIVGIPVYAGRVPNVLLKYFDTVTGNGAKAVAVVLYGNRNYDDALIELTDILTDHGFEIAAAGAFIGEHSFSDILAKDRPDASDMKKVEGFAGDIYEKIMGNKEFHLLEIAGEKPYRKYYQPKDRDGNPYEFRLIIPKTNKDACIDCKHCAEICPMGSISYDDTSVLNGICIKCCACIKGCPVGAKYFDDENYQKHRHELEFLFAERREPVIFI